MEEQLVKKKNKKLKYGIIFGIIIIVLAAVIIINPLMTFHKETIELGEAPDSDIAHYMRGTESMLHDAFLDISQVNGNEVGNYKAYVNYLFLTFTYDIEVKDTVAPELILKEPLYIAVERFYEPEELIEKAVDKSNSVSLSFEENIEEFTTNELGTGMLTIVATDPSGNSSKTQVPYTAEKAPYFLGIVDNTIALGSDYNPLDYIVAGDDKFGNISKDIQVNLAGFTSKKAGNYSVEYTVTNAHGLSTSAVQNLTVASQNQLMLNSWSNEDKLKLFDMGYFKYAPLEEASREKTLELVAPCLVDFFSDNCNGRLLSIAGSGVIYRIDSDYTYILSNHHVYGGFKDGANDMTITFYNGAKMPGLAIPTEIRLEDDNIDIGLIKIKTSDIPFGILLRLKEAYHDQLYVDSLAPGTRLIEFATHWDGGDKDVIKDVVLQNWSGLAKDFQDYFEKYRTAYFATTYGAIGGMSGTGIFDEKGYFVGQVAKGSYGFSSNYDICVKDDYAAELFEKGKTNGGNNN